MTIEIFSHNEQHSFVDIESFKNELKSCLKYNQNIKVFFINNPRIKGMIDTNVDLLLILALENKDRNYLIVDNYNQYSMKNNQESELYKKKPIYFNNLIIPIKFISHLKDKSILKPETERYVNYLYTSDGLEEDISMHTKELYYKTKKYLENIWREHQLDIKKDGESISFEISPHPIVWVISPDFKYYDFSKPNFIYAPKFGFLELESYLKNTIHQSNSFTSNKHWSIERNNHKAYEIINEHIELLKKQLEKDNKIGTLTASKIKRLNHKYSEDLKIYEKYLLESETNKTSSDENIFDLVFAGEKQSKTKKKTELPDRIRADKEVNNNLIIINGKAGSGKTFEMLLLIKKNYERENGGYYLTYNKLLANDVKYIRDKYQKGEKKTVVKTIHQFMYRLAKKGLGILSIMTKKRYDELKNIQENRQKAISSYLRTLPSLDNLDTIKPSQEFDLGTRELFLRFISKNRMVTKDNIFYYLDKYVKNNIKIIESELSNNVFLKDYYKVLQYILMAKNNPEKLFYELGLDTIQDEEWDKLIEEKQKEYPRDPKGFGELLRRSIGSTVGKGILFVDEAQDCHPLERDILLSFWGKKNIVVCTGGKEQLIRHSNECNWKINENEGLVLHNVIEIKKRNRTYRLKENIVKLCNFIANEFQINLDLSANNIGSDDKGSVIIELNDSNNHKLYKVVENLVRKGEYNELVAYESILFLTESLSTSVFTKPGECDVNDIVIDYNDNILHTKQHRTKISHLSTITGIPDEQFFFHNQGRKNDELDDNAEDNEPTADTYRSIFYESCRGLEAWSVVCLDLDLFYQRKYDEEFAASYLSDDLFLSEHERRSKYAATWLLMALTRPIDTLYVHVNDKDSTIGLLLQKYVDQYL